MHVKDRSYKTHLQTVQANDVKRYRWGNESCSRLLFEPIALGGVEEAATPRTKQGSSSPSLYLLLMQRRANAATWPMAFFDWGGLSTRKKDIHPWHGFVGFSLLGDPQISV